MWWVRARRCAVQQIAAAAAIQAEPASREMLRNLVELVDRLVCFAGHQPMHIQSAQLANALGNAIPGITIAVTANA
jgi:hypothetical protein